MIMPWWAKIFFKILLSRLPISYFIWHKVGLFRHGMMDDPFYAVGIFNLHCEQAGLTEDLRGNVILELGPGDGVSTAIIAASYGANAILVDSVNCISEDVNLYKSFSIKLIEMGLQPPDISNAKNIEDILRICGSSYFSSGLASMMKIPSNSVDLVFSHAVLEHVREHEFLQTMVECKRVLKHGGVVSHRVDLKDHLGGGLNNLRFSKKVWESNFFVSSGFYTNRIRYSKMTALMRKAGFEIINSEVDLWNDIPISRGKLAAEFASESKEDLLVKGFNIVLK